MTRRNWAAFYKARQSNADHAQAEGQSRPAPGLEPPLREDSWIDQRIAAQKAREEADRQDREESQEGPQQ